MLVIYKENIIHNFKCWVNHRCFRAISKWQVGGLTYFRLNEFEVKAIDTDMIVEIV